MLKSGILNPRVAELLCRIRHTNTLVIADWAFPYWPQIETVDISLVAGIPSIIDVLDAIRPNFQIGRAWMAEEFLQNERPEARGEFAKALAGIPLVHEPHVIFKKRVPHAIGLIRTGDATPYGNVIIESA
jgi:D-ribose pyranase